MTSFFVPGIPVPKGSARAYVNRYTGRVAVMQSNAAKQKPWASLITVKAEESGCKQNGGGCQLKLKFFMPRPKAHFRSNGELKESARIEHTKKPDLDKLIRCVKDALSGVAYQDDSQVTRILAAKYYAMPGEPTGCRINVTT